MKIHLVFVKYAVIVLVIFASGCTQRYNDKSDTFVSNKISLNSDKYRVLVWLNDHELALIGPSHSADPVSAKRFESPYVLDIHTGALTGMRPPAPNRICTKLWSIDVYDHQSLAIEPDCNLRKDHINERQPAIYILRNPQGEAELLCELDPKRAPVESRFNPTNPNEWVHVEAITYSLSNRMVLYNGCNPVRTIEPAFFDIVRPQWSPAGKMIAFTGLANDPGLAETNPKWKGQLFAVRALFAYDVSTETTTHLVSGFDSLQAVGWSDDSSYLYFIGEYARGINGLWRLSLTSKEVELLWRGEARNGAVSPDHRSFAMLVKRKINGENLTEIEIVSDQKK